MKKTFNSVDERTTGYGPGYLIDSNSPDFLVGRLLTLIETLGLSEKQERATKDMLRSEVYGILNQPNTVWVNGNLRNIIKDFTVWHEEQNWPTSGSSDEKTPYDCRSGQYELTFTKLG